MHYFKYYYVAYFWIKICVVMKGSHPHIKLLVLPMECRILTPFFSNMVLHNIDSNVTV